MSDITLHQLELTDEEIIKIIANIIGASIDLTKNNDPNELNIYMYTKANNQVRDVFFIQGLKDIKTCNIIWLNPNTTGKRVLITIADYAIDVLGMEEVFIRVDKNNKSLVKYLENNEFESLGEEEKDIIFLKEKLNEQIKNRTI